MHRSARPIGQTIDNLGQRLAALAEKDRPGQVIVAILTDGLENASQRFTWKEIAGKVKHQTDTYKWIFLFWAPTKTPSPLRPTSVSQQTTPPTTLLTLPAQKQARQPSPAR